MQNQEIGQTQGTKSPVLAHCGGGKLNLSEINSSKTTQKDGVIYTNNSYHPNAIRVGMSDSLHSSSNPIVTTGLVTFGVGMFANSINYFSHLSLYCDSGEIKSGIMWNEAIQAAYTKNNGKKIDMYVFTMSKLIPENKTPFFDQIDEDKVNVIIIDLRVDSSASDAERPVDADTFKLMVGMNKIPIGYYPIEYIKTLEAKKLATKNEKLDRYNSFLGKTFKYAGSRLNTLNDKMRLMVDTVLEVNDDLMYLVCKVIINYNGIDVIDDNPSVKLHPEEIEIVCTRRRLR